MKLNAKAKLDSFVIRNSVVGKLFSEYNRIEERENEARGELASLEASLDGIRIGGLANLKTQFLKAQAKTDKT